MHSDLLKVNKSALRHLQLPRIFITILTIAPFRLSIFELLNHFLTKLATVSALEHSYLKLRSDFRCARHSPAQFDKFSQEVTFESPDAEVCDIFVTVIETTLVGFLIFLISPIIGGIFLLFFLNVLSECFVDDWFVFVVLMEDKAG